MITSEIMKKTLLILSTLILSVALFSSCKQSDIDPKDPLIGTWVYKNYQQINGTEYLTVYTRKANFDNDNSGISFRGFSKLIERKNVGWCGTPPISYGEYNGSYTLKNKLITMESDGWNGKTTSRYEIISVDDNLLKIKLLN